MDPRYIKDATIPKIKLTQDKFYTKLRKLQTKFLFKNTAIFMLLLFCLCPFFVSVKRKHTENLQTLCFEHFLVGLILSIFPTDLKYM